LQLLATVPRRALQKRGGEAILLLDSRRLKFQWMEKKMNLLKKAAISLAATSMIAAPVAASAAPMVADAGAVSRVDGQSELEGSSGWLIGLLALIAIVGGIVIAAGNNDDSPTSP